MTSLHPYGGPAVLIAGVDATSVPVETCTPAVRLVVASLDAGQITLKDVNGTARPSDGVDLLSLDICAGIAFSDDGLDLLRTLADERARLTPGDRASDFEIVRASDRTEIAQAISTAVQGGLMRVLADMAGRNAALVRALAAVRQEHEVLQDAFASLEEVVASSSVLDKPAFFLAPTRQGLSPGQNWVTDDAIHQRLPVSSRAVSAVDLCFLVNDEGSEGVFDVVLRTLEDDREAGHWRVPFGPASKQIKGLISK